MSRTITAAELRPSEHHHAWVRINFGSTSIRGRVTAFMHNYGEFRTISDPRGDSFHESTTVRVGPWEADLRPDQQITLLPTGHEATASTDMEDAR